MNSKNLIGMRVGKPEVIADSGQRKNGYILRRCRCGCGNGILVPTNRLTAGVTTDCGCVPKEKRKCRAAEDLTGQKFGYLTVLKRIENKCGRSQWLCRCVCGKLTPQLRSI